MVSYEDSTSPEFYELERDAIWKRAWLNLGRVEQLPRNGSYFTKELAVAKTSIIVVRGLDGEVRAFHNICRHRGNKLVWQDYPREETSGSCRQFVCKYHGWQYDLDGGCTFVQQESEFFDLNKADYGLVPVHCDVWAGFIFVNLDREPTQSLRDFLGPMITAMDEYPFDLMTERFSYTTEIYSNWKIYLDAFQEFYHASILHSQQQVPSARSDPPAEFYGAHYEIDGPHRVVSTSGWQGVPRHLMPPERMYPIEHVTGSGVLGPWERPDLDFDLDDPPGVNPGDVVPWGISNFQIFPNIELLVYERGWYLTYHYWPTVPQHPHLGGHVLLRAVGRASRARAARGRGGDVEGLRAAGCGNARGDAARAGVRRDRPLPAVRPGDHRPPLPQGGGRLGRRVPPQRRNGNGNGTIAMSDGAMLPPGFADLERVRGEVVPGVRARAVRRAHGRSMEEMQDFYDACYPARRRGDRLLRQVPARRPARRRPPTCSTSSTR